jgi:chorismate mutase
VQEIADALRGVDVPVLIKNPINPDLELWTGAVERVANAGIEKIGLIHRGFSSYGAAEYRNPPLYRLISIDS